MNHTPSTLTFSDAPNAVGLPMWTAMLQYGQQICQFELESIQKALADDEAATQHPKSSRDTAKSPQQSTHLPADAYSKLFHHGIGLSRVMFQGSLQMAAAMHKSSVEALDRLREQTSRATPAIPGIAPAVPNYMLSAMESGMGHAMATLDEWQNLAVENTDAVLQAAEENANENENDDDDADAGKHAKSNARAKRNGSHASDSKKA